MTTKQAPATLTQGHHITHIIKYHTHLDYCPHQRGRAQVSTMQPIIIALTFTDPWHWWQQGPYGPHLNLPFPQPCAKKQAGQNCHVTQLSRAAINGIEDTAPNTSTYEVSESAHQAHSRIKYGIYNYCSRLIIMHLLLYLEIKPSTKKAIIRTHLVLHGVMVSIGYY